MTLPQLPQHAFELQFTILPAAFSESTFRNFLFRKAERFCEDLEFLNGYDIKIHRQTHIPLEALDQLLPLSMTVSLYMDDPSMAQETCSEEALKTWQASLIKAMQNEYDPAKVKDSQVAQTFIKQVNKLTRKPSM